MAAEITPSSELKQATAELWRDRIDSGGAAGNVSILDSNNAVLATLSLSYPCGAHSNGKLVFSPISASLVSGTGTAVAAVFKKSTGAVVLTTNVSSQSGTAFCRLNTTALVEDSSVSVTSCEIQF